LFVPAFNKSLIQEFDCAVIWTGSYLHAYVYLWTYSTAGCTYYHECRKFLIL